MRKLASVQVVKNIRDVENSDNLQVVDILGFTIVINKKENIKINDLVVYLETDSVLPEKPEFEFLRPRKHRVRICKFRKQISEGLIFPLSILPEVRSSWKEGEDVTELLGVTQYITPQEEEVIERLPKNKFLKKLCRYKFFRNILLEKNIKCDYPKHLIHRSDLDRIQTMPDAFEKHFKGTSGWSVTEKVEGTNSCNILNTETKKYFKVFKRTKKEFYVCSHNNHLKTKHRCWYWDNAIKQSIKEKLLKVPYDVGIIGEIIGTSIQKNYYQLPDKDYYIFTVKNLSENRYFSNEEVLKFCEEYGFKMVPTVDSNYTIPETIQELVEFSDGYSKINPKLLREGIVLRKGVHSFKVINPKYLLKNDL